MNASRSDSRATACSAGSASAGTTRPSGIGSIQVVSGSGGASGPSAVPGAERSIGSARRFRAPSASKQTLLAMRYSHDRRAERPSKPS